MKKALLFLLLFAAGISILRWIEEPVKLDPASPPNVRSEPFAPPDTVAAREVQETGNAGNLSFSGKFAYTQNEGGRKVYDLVAAGSRTVGDLVELDDLTGRVYDRETGEMVLSIRAAGGSAKLVQEKDTKLGEFHVSLDKAIDLRDVEATLLRDAPIVPLTLSAPDLVGRLDEGHFHTGGRVTISGTGISASGTGFEFFVDRGILRFLSDGNATVEVEAGRNASLDCRGGLSIESPPEGAREITLDAHEDASVKLAGREDLELHAQHIRVSGRPRSGGSEPFGFDRIEATEEVRLVTPTSEFTSNRAEIELEGSATRFVALLIGDPKGRLVFSSDAGAALPVLDDAFSVSFRGEGPLEVTRSDAVEFHLPGPAALDWKGARLTARDSLTGSFGPVADDALFVALGGVEIVRPDGSLETEEFRLRHERPLTGESRVSASATGPSRLIGEADAEHDFVLLTGERIDFALEGEVWRVPRALGVDLSVEGPRGFVARAAEVSEMSIDPLGLEAHGSIALDSEEGTLRGSRLSLRGPEHMIVEGAPGEPVTFRWQRVEGVAERVERSENLLIAEGVERASLAYQGDAHEISCRRLLVAEETVETADGELVETVRFTARDDVQVRTQRETDALSLDCDEIEGSLERHERGGEFLWSGSTLTATGNVGGRYSHAGTNFELTSERLVVERTDRGTEELSSARLVAQGKVIMDSRGEVQIHGEGDELEVDKLGRGRLTALGDGRVTAVGVFPGKNHPFSMTGRWVQFSDTFLAAAEPEVDFWLTEGETARKESLHVRGKAERLEADREGVSFVGRVRLENVESGPQSWVLSAESARMEARRAAGNNLLAGLRADGDVAFRLGTSLVAYGDEFSVRAEQRRIRVVGSPARLFHQGMVWTGEEFEYDLVVHVLTAKNFEVGPRREDP